MVAVSQSALEKYIVETIIPLMNKLDNEQDILSLTRLEIKKSDELNAYYIKNLEADSQFRLLEPQRYAPVIAGLLRNVLGFGESSNQIILNEIQTKAKQKLQNHKFKRFNQGGVFNEWFNKFGWVFVYRELATNQCRIGVSMDFKQRVQGLRNSLQAEVDFIHCVFTEDAVELKTHLMNKYAASLHENGWYSLTDADIDYFKSGLLGELNKKIRNIVDLSVPWALYPGQRQLWKLRRTLEKEYLKNE